MNSALEHGLLGGGGGTYPSADFEESAEITWNGEAFVSGSKISNVLRYPMPCKPSGWSDELTNFIEETSRGRHPIDIASIEIAMESCRDFASKQEKNIRILEVGCSSGFMLRRLRKELPHADICGADIIGNTLQRLAVELKSEGIPTPLLEFDLTTCPFPDSSFDVVIAMHVLEHIKDHETAASEIFRILKPGGVFIFEVPVGGTGLYDDFDREMGHCRRYASAEIQCLLSNSGLLKKRVSHLGVFIYPAFWMIKKCRGKFFKSNKGIKENPSIVTKMLIQGSGNYLFSLMFKLELFLRRFISWPFGMRCTGVFSKPGLPPESRDSIARSQGCACTTKE